MKYRNITLVEFAGEYGKRVWVNPDFVTAVHEMKPFVPAVHDRDASIPVPRERVGIDLVGASAEDCSVVVWDQKADEVVHALCREWITVEAES